jgi:hypothetical protein
LSFKIFAFCVWNFFGGCILELLSFFGISRLEPGIYLGFGNWDLEFFL